MSRATVLAPLRSEWVAVRSGVRSTDVVRTGCATGMSWAGPSLVAGVAGGLADGLEPGDIVVADEVRRDGWVLPSHAAPFLAGALRRAGLRVHRGPIVTTDHLVDTAVERSALAGAGALAVDTESGLLAGANGQTAVLRAVADTPSRPLRSLSTVSGGLRALMSLRKAGPVIDAWAAATGDRRVLLAGPRSFCAGVERAIDIVELALERFGKPVYVRRQIVHNRHVVEDLESRGAVFVEEADEVPEGAVLVLAAHGVAPSVRDQAAERNLQVIDATCPLVSKVHQEVRRFAAADRTVLLIGHEDHEEVVGTRGEAPEHVVVVADPAEAARVQVRDPEKVSYVMQTTLSVDEAAETAAVLRERFPVLAAPGKDDICYATTNRQQAVREIARDSDLVIVIGSQNSSNSQRLAEVAESCGTPARLVDDAEGVDLAWLAGAPRIGITAGASAPPALVAQMITALSGLGSVEVEERTTVNEDVQFSLPKQVAR